MDSKQKAFKALMKQYDKGFDDAKKLYKVENPYPSPLPRTEAIKNLVHYKHVLTTIYMNDPAWKNAARGLNFREMVDTFNTAINALWAVYEKEKKND